jgi:[ribosomal protein S18]-alanine N-acetyltransferase
MLLRPLVMADLPAIITIECKACRFPWTIGNFRDSLNCSGYLCFGLEIQEKLMGYGILSVVVGESHLFKIVIDPDVQNQGYGTFLVRYLLYVAKRNGASIMFLEVRESNKKAFHVYHQLGFNEIRTRKNYYPTEKGREHAIELALELREDPDFYYDLKFAKASKQFS